MELHRYGDLLDPALRTLTRARIRSMQEERLLAMLPHAYAHSPLTREVWMEAGVHPRDIRSFADFHERAPFTSQDRIRRFREKHGDVYGGLLCVDPSRMNCIGTTSGTTGNPTPAPFLSGSASETAQSRQLSWCLGLQPGEVFVHTLFTFRSGHSFGRFNRLGVVPVYMNHMPGEIDLYLDACRRFRPAASGNMNHAMVWEIGRRAAEEGLDVKALFSSFRAFNFGGDRIPNTLRKLVAGWGPPIFDTASTGDAAGCSECRMHDGFHAWEDMVHVEVLEPGGRAPVAEGKMGELVVTSLVDFHAPFIRTRTDDLVIWSSQPCGCGMQFGRHWTLGRTGDVVPVAGRDILPRQVAERVENQPETVAALFQILRHKGLAVEPTLALRVGYSKRLLKGDPSVAMKHLRERLEADIQAQFSVPVEVSLIEDVELHKIGPPHKIPRILKI